jgi:N-acetylglutamate synthase-like GNAT family acetyltransferase
MIAIKNYSEKYRNKVMRLVLNVLENEFKINKTKRKDLTNIPHEYQSKKNRFLIALENDNVIGTIALKDVGKKRGYLKRFYVKKSKRKKGTGKKLFKKIISHAKKNGFQKIYAATSKIMIEAEEFYQKNGFKKIKKMPKTIPIGNDTQMHIKKMNILRKTLN